MTLIFAGNWKMHHGPTAARAFLDAWLTQHEPRADRVVWFFPPAASLPAVAAAIAGHADLACGVQNLHWEPKGAFTGETSVAIARDAGATLALVGHSERRHVFGETDADCARKVRACLDGGVRPVLCVGETLAQRESGETLTVVRSQLGALDGLSPRALSYLTIAYEPVWAIGTGRTATPDDADQVQGAVRADLVERGAPEGKVPILYGGSVKPDNAAQLVAREHVDGLLVGGASLEPDAWAAITAAGD